MLCELFLSWLEWPGRAGDCFKRLVDLLNHFPNLERAAEGVFHHVFCQREVADAEDPGRGRDHAPGFVPE